MADGWEAFDAPSASAKTPAAVMAQPAPDAPASDGWAAFDAAPAQSGAPAASAPRLYDEFDANGKWIGQSTEGFQSARAVPHTESTPPATKTGYGANAAAGVIEGGAGVLNTIADPFGNLVGKPLVTLGVAAHDALAPVFGYDRFPPSVRNALLEDTVPQPGTRLVDAVGQAISPTATSDVRPDGPGQSIVRAAVPAAVGMAALGGGQGVLQNAVVNPLLGVSGALTGEAASAFVPDWLEPAAGLAGNVLGTAGVASAGRGAYALAEPLFAKRNALLDDSGAPVIGSNLMPLTATAGEARAAGEQLRASATNPDAARAALDNPPAPLMPGDQPTTARLAQDPGLLSAEATASRTGTDQQKAAFRAQADRQNDARVQVLQGVASEGDAAAADAALKQHAAAADAALASDVSRARSVASGAANALPGDLPAGSEATIGSALRAPAAAAEATAHGVRAAMYDAIDPAGELALDMTGVREGGARIRREMSVNEAPQTGAEKAIFDTVAAVPDVQKFSDLRALRTRITSQMRGAKMDPERQAEYGRLTGLLRHVEGVMDDAAGTADIAAPPATESASVPDQVVPAIGTTAYTPSGTPVPVRYVVREADDLTASQLPDGRVNPAYPAELQPRDRTRAASVQQVNSIANRLNPERLGASASTAEGAPIVGPDGIVESGNGRTLAIKQSYAEGGSRADTYRAWIEGQGYDTTGMRQPVLVRERVTQPEESLADRARLADDMGAPAILGMSAGERAAADAKRIPGDILGLWRGGDVTDARNTDFARAFANHVVPDTERASFITADGTLSAEGAARMRNALTQHAYGSNSLVSTMAENADPDIKAFGGALMDAAGDMGKLRAAMDADTINKTSDIAPDLVEAAQLLQTARRQRISLSAAVRQRDAFSGRGVLVDDVLRLAFGPDLAGRMSRAKFADLLSAFANEAQVQSGLFGANESASEILARVGSSHGYETTGGRGAGDASVTSRAGGGQNGDQARGSPDVARGQEDTGGVAARNTDRTISDPAAAPPGLTPNLDPAALERYRAANAQNVADVARFRNAPGVGDMLAPGPTKGTFAAPASAVPNLIVKVGPAGRDVAEAYLRAGGDPAALADAAAYSLRRAATREDGTLDPGKMAAWAKARASFLSTVPDLAARFRDVASAQLAVDSAMANQAAAAKAMQSSAIGKFLGDADPVARVWSILNDKANGQAHARQLVEAIGSDPVAMAGLRRAAAEAIERNVIGTARGATSEEAGIMAGTFEKLMRHAEPTLREFMTPDQVHGILSARDSLVRDTRSAQVGVGSPTVQYGTGAARGLVGKLAMATGGMLGGGTIGSLIGGWLGGGAGVLIGSNVGLAVAKVTQAAHEAGIQNIADLRTEALLNPKLYRLLDTRATEQNGASLLASIAAELGRASLVGAVRANPDRHSFPEPPRNALLH